MTIFCVQNVSFAYPGQEPSVQNVSFSVQRGERLALIGANGSGKSTLLHLLDGLYFAQQGSVQAFGEQLTEEGLETAPFGPQFRKDVGFLFQNSDAQLFSATVEEELAFAPLQLRWKKELILQRITETLDMLDIARLRKRAPQNLSGGEKKRVALASLLIVNPKVLLLDEPTAGLDPRSQSMLVEILQQLHQQAGMTLITSTHDMALLPHLADRALVLSESHTLVADDSAERVLADTDLLLSANLIHAHTHSHDGLTHAHAHLHRADHTHPHAR